MSKKRNELLVVGNAKEKTGNQQLYDKGHVMR